MNGKVTGRIRNSPSFNTIRHSEIGHSEIIPIVSENDMVNPKGAPRAQRFASPFRAMLWKEWRESWWLLALTVIVPAAWQAIGMREVLSLGRFIGRFQAADFLIPQTLLAGLLGARLFAPERANGTADFQDDRPARREWVWRVRLLLPAIAIVAGYVAGAALVAPEHTRFAMFIVTEEWLSTGGAVLLAFSSGVLASVICENAVTAIAGAGALFAVAEGVWLVAMTRLIGKMWLTWWPILAIAAILVAVECAAYLYLSLVVYRRRT